MQTISPREERRRNVLSSMHFWQVDYEDSITASHFQLASLSISGNKEIAGIVP